MNRKRDYKREYRRRLQLKELREQQLAAPPRLKKKRRKKRDYKVEYRARKLRDVKKIVERDARRVFGTKPKRGPKQGSRYDPSPLVTIDYADVLAEKKKRDGVMDWTNEDEFIGSLTDLGMPVQEAYTLWFSP